MIGPASLAIGDNDAFSSPPSSASTALNLVMFSTSFVMQWGIGALADMASTSLGLDPADGLRVAFAVVLVAETLAYLWFAMGWRRHALAGRLASVVA